MTVMKLGFDSHSTNASQALGRSRPAQDPLTANRVQGSGKAFDGATDGGIQKPQSLHAASPGKDADPGSLSSQGPHGASQPELASIENLMGVYMYQAQMAAATGDSRKAEMLAKMAIGMVDRARNAVAGAIGGISEDARKDPAAAMEGMADLSRSVQSIAVQARNVASIAATIKATKAPQPDGQSQPDGRQPVEDAIQAMVQTFRDVQGAGQDGREGAGGGVSSMGTVSTEA